MIKLYVLIVPVCYKKAENGTSFKVIYTKGLDFAVYTNSIGSFNYPLSFRKTTPYFHRGLFIQQNVFNPKSYAI